MVDVFVFFFYFGGCWNSSVQVGLKKNKLINGELLLPSSVGFESNPACFKYLERNMYTAETIV